MNAYDWWGEVAPLFGHFLQPSPNIFEMSFKLPKFCLERCTNVSTFDHSKLEITPQEPTFMESTPRSGKSPLFAFSLKTLVFLLRLTAPELSAEGKKLITQVTAFHPDKEEETHK